MNINNPTTFSTPDLTLSTANSSGTAGALRADDTILVYDTTVPTSNSSGASAATGSSSTSARRDHVHGNFTVTAAATQAQLETGSITTAYTSPGRQQYHPSAAKTWAYVTNDGTPALAASYNVASIADQAVGETRVSYTTAFSSVNYAPLGSTRDLNQSSTATVVSFNAVVVGSCDVRTYRVSTAALIDEHFQFAALGDQ